jgi:hypothetical protein
MKPIVSFDYTTAAPTPQTSASPTPVPTPKPGFPPTPVSTPAPTTSPQPSPDPTGLKPTPPPSPTSSGTPSTTTVDPFGNSLASSSAVDIVSPVVGGVVGGVYCCLLLLLVMFLVIRHRKRSRKNNDLIPSIELSSTTMNETNNNNHNNQNRDNYSVLPELSWTHGLSKNNGSFSNWSDVVIPPPQKSSATTGNTTAASRQTQNNYTASPYREFVSNRRLQELVIDFKELKLGNVLGEGNFGVVQRAQFRGMDVAVKLVKGEFESARDSLKREAEVMANIPPHHNVVQLLAFCEKPLAAVFEFVDGPDLRS